MNNKELKGAIENLKKEIKERRIAGISFLDEMEFCNDLSELKKTIDDYNEDIKEMNQLDEIKVKIIELRELIEKFLKGNPTYEEVGEVCDDELHRLNVEIAEMIGRLF